MNTVQMAAMAAISSQFENAKKEIASGVHEVDVTINVSGTFTKGADTVTTRVNPGINPERVLTWLLATNPELVHEAIKASSAPGFVESYTGPEPIQAFMAQTQGIALKIQMPRSGSVSAKTLKVVTIP
jgi:hypothetical protein